MAFGFRKINEGKKNSGADWLKMAKQNGNLCEKKFWKSSIITLVDAPKNTGTNFYF